MSTMTEQRNRRARDAALAAASGLTVEPTSLIGYESRGRVTVIGGQRALEAAALMDARLEPRLILTDGEPAGEVSHLSALHREIAVAGYLGNFTVTLGATTSEAAVELASDLVLDLSGSPLLSAPLNPPGYMTSGPAKTDLRLAVDALAELTGTFEKPKYFAYDPSLCAHGRSGTTACSRCIDVCPADAITGLGETVAVNPYLCQGGGACASVCPGGAIRYVYPSVQDTLARLRRMLAVYRKEGGEEPIVVFHAQESALPDPVPANALPAAVEELASVGIEVWLSALAYGAGAVLLFDDGRVPVRVREAIEQQRTTASEILSGMGYPVSAVRWVEGANLAGACGEALMPPISPAAYEGAGGKRRTAFMAIDALHEQALAGAAARARPLVTLTVGAAFGEARVDESSCTLCLACVGACPGNALQGGQDVPQLRFIESNCLQCGLCTRTCPEDAIWIAPRLLFDREERGRPRTLHEASPFCCVSCGKPFATRSVIDRMLKRLEGHWMFRDGRARRRLMMCEDCRVVDAVQDPEMMERDVRRDGMMQ